MARRLPSLGLLALASGCLAYTHWLGDLEVWTESEHDDFCDRYSQVFGDVEVRFDASSPRATPPATDLSDLDCIAYIGGDLRLVEPGPLERARLPALARLGAGVRVEAATDLVVLELPKLEEAGWAESHAGQIVILDTPALEGIDLGQVVALDLLLIDRSASLQRLVAPNLADASVRVVDAGLAELWLPSLVSAAGLTLDGLPRLTSLSLPELQVVDGDLRIEGNALLEDLTGLGRLRGVGGDLIIQDNRSLPPAAARALVAQIGEQNVGGEVRLSNNGPTE